MVKYLAYACDLIVHMHACLLPCHLLIDISLRSAIYIYACACRPLVISARFPIYVLYKLVCLLFNPYSLHAWYLVFISMYLILYFSCYFISCFKFFTVLNGKGNATIYFSQGASFCCWSCLSCAVSGQTTGQFPKNHMCDTKPYVCANDSASA